MVKDIWGYFKSAVNLAWRPAWDSANNALFGITTTLLFSGYVAKVLQRWCHYGDGTVTDWTFVLTLLALAYPMLLLLRVVFVVPYQINQRLQERVSELEGELDQNNSVPFKIGGLCDRRYPHCYGFESRNVYLRRDDQWLVNPVDDPKDAFLYLRLGVLLYSGMQQALCTVTLTDIAKDGIFLMQDGCWELQWRRNANPPETSRIIYYRKMEYVEVIVVTKDNRLQSTASGLTGIDDGTPLS